MREKLVVAGAVCAALLLLTGCGSDSSAAASTENADTCTEFGTSYNEFVGIVEDVPTDPAGVDTWTANKTAALEKFTPLSESATGDVKAALTTLVSELPADSLELSEPDSESGKKFVDNSAAVASACESDGTSLTLDEFPLLKF